MRPRDVLFTFVVLLAVARVGAAQQPRAGDAEALTLSAAIDQALRQSPRLRPAEDTRARAEIQRRVATARYSPRIAPDLSTGSAPASLARQSVGVSMAQLLPTGAEVRGALSSVQYGTGDAAFKDAGYDVNISQPLLRGFGATNRAELKSAADAIDAAARVGEDARQQLVLDTARAYFEVVRRQRLAAETRRAVARAEKLLDMSTARTRVGLSTQLDVLRANLLLTETRSAALRGLDALEASRDELNVLLGRTPGTPLVAAEDVAADVSSVEVSGASEGAGAAPPTEALIARAFTSRLDLQNAKARVVEARRVETIARWNVLPQISLDVGYMRRGLAGGPSAGYASLFNGWRVGFSTSYALDRAASSAAASLAQIDVRAAERARADAEQRVAVEVRRAARSVDRAAEGMSLAASAVDLASKQRELATYRFERGLADNLELVDAENNLFRTESGLIDAEIDRALAMLARSRAAGILNPERFLR